MVRDKKIKVQKVEEVEEVKYVAERIAEGTGFITIYPIIKVIKKTKKVGGGANG